MTAPSPNLSQMIAEMPKIELHVHLEGAIQPATLLKLAERHNIRLPAADETALREWYKFRNFPHFADIYQQVSKCLRTVDDIELVCYDFLAFQHAHNVVYTEFHFTAFTHFQNYGLPFRDQLAALNRGRARAREAFGIESGIIVDIARERLTPEEGLIVADWVIDAHGDGVVALGLGGYEPGFPPAKFKQALHRARDAGVPLVIHAGETGGVQSIREAVDLASPTRIEHGVFALDDHELTARMRDQGIVCDVCPSSNIALGVFTRWEDHTLPRMLAEGLLATLNTDDPPMFGTDISLEHQNAVERLGLSVEHLNDMYRNAVHGALCGTEDKTRLTKRLHNGQVADRPDHVTGAL